MTVLDVNDELPTFTQSHYNITLTEDTPVSSRPVLTVRAVDRDAGLAGRVSYSIVSGDGMDKFHIDAGTGALTVISPLDYETKTSYRYWVLLLLSAYIVRSLSMIPTHPSLAMMHAVIKLMPTCEPGFSYCCHHI